MEIDSKGRMWIVDVGRQNNMKGDQIEGTPSLWIFDLTATTTSKKGVKSQPKQLLRYNFSEDVASSKTSFINDIVVDDVLDVAYISEASGDGAIIVFDLKTETARRVTHESMKASADYDFVLDEVQMKEFKIPIDGIALTPDKATVYFNALLANHLYSVPAQELRDYTPGASLNIAYHGVKPASDGLAFGSNGKLYFGSLPDNSVLEWTPGTPLDQARVIAKSAEDLSWPDTFGFDNKGNLLVLSNRLHKWVTGQLNFDGAESNFRIVSIPIGENVRSYVYGPDAPAQSEPEATTVPTTAATADPAATTVSTVSETSKEEASTQTTAETTTVPATEAPAAGSTSTEAASSETTEVPAETTVAPATTETTTETTTSSTTAPTSTTTAPTSEKKKSPGMRAVEWVQAKAERAATWIEEKLPGKGTLPRLSWCSIACTWNKTKALLVAARDRLHVCAANTTECADDIQEVYQKDALTSGIALCAAFALICWLGAVITDDLSWVDRLWSVLPVIYTLHFWSYDKDNARLSVMVTLALAWGVRLTYNFYRKGGYTSHGEDYRWAVLRKEIPNPWLFHLFNLVFIAVLQNILLFAITLPAYTALVNETPLNFGDIVASLTFFLALALETMADQQQWVFQESKHNKLPRLPELAHDYENGFLTSGLFVYSRHPNFFAEQVIWISFALFSLTATGDLELFSWFGALSLVLLFQGSTTFTEKITKSKYPAYAEYQQTTSRLWPLPPVSHPHSD